MASIDTNKEIRRAVDTGKVVFGVRGSEKNILKGDALLIIISSNIPKLTAERISAISNAAGKHLYHFSGTALELGAVCGKPFAVSVMVVKDAGKSKIMGVVKAEKRGRKK